MFIFDLIASQGGLLGRWVGSKEKSIREMRQRSSGTSSGRGVCVIRPGTIKECQEAAACLQAGNVTILDLRKLGQAPAQQAIALVSDTAYDIGGNFSQISQGIFIAAPAGVGLTREFGGLEKRTQFNCALEGGSREWRIA